MNKPYNKMSKHITNPKGEFTVDFRSVFDKFNIEFDEIFGKSVVSFTKVNYVLNDILFDINL